MTTVNRLLLYGIATAMIAFLSGCADLNSDLPAPDDGLVKIHPAGWTDPVSSNFHGEAIKHSNWNLAQCQTCHGSKYTGGIANVSCTPCHNKPLGPENCATCHGGTNAAPPNDLDGNVQRSAPGVGAHQAHLLGSSLAGAVLCSDCHNVPGAVSSPGHIDGTGEASVPFPRMLANIVTNLPGAYRHSDSVAVVHPAPAYDRANNSCAGSYCHGTFKNGNTANAPVWNDTTGTQAKCGTCHGDVTKSTLAEKSLPKTRALGGTHPDNLNCANCHADVVDAAIHIIGPSKHINGRLNVFGIEREF